MRACIAIPFVLACGPIYKDPPQQPPPAPPAPPSAYQAGPPGAADVDGDGVRDDAPSREPDPPAANEPPPRVATSRSTAPAAMQAVLDLHNEHRARHCAPPLTWSPKLAVAAQMWADDLKAQGCKFGHKPRNPYGENLAAGTSGTLDGRAVTNLWYDEVKLYKFPNGGFSMATGHFTQLVWRGTTQLGCGVTTCNGMDIWVCEYDPPGNVETQYRAHVLPVGCRP